MIFTVLSIFLNNLSIDLEQIRKKESELSNLSKSIIIAEEKLGNEIQSKCKKFFTSAFPQFYELFASQMEKEEYERTMADLERELSSLREDYKFYSMDNEEDLSTMPSTSIID